MIELYLRLAGATLLLLAPGALLARSASGALVTSLTLIFGAMLVVFATGSSLTLALWLLLAAGLAAIPVGLRRRSLRATDPIWLAVLGVGVLAGLLLWHVLPEPSGDALFHLARVRKLVAFDELSLEGVGEFVDGGLHPGYAFPLWHAFLALVAKIAGVDPADVVVHEAAVLAPLSFLVVYEAGVAVFRSRWLGVATLAATVGLTALASGSGGALRLLALPATAGGRLLLVPAALALVFTYLHEPTRARLALVAGRGPRARGRAPDVRALPAARAGRLRRRPCGARAVGAPLAAACGRGVRRRRRRVPGVALPRRAGHGVVHAVERAGAGEGARDSDATPASSS